MSIVIELAGAPVAKGRPKFARIGNGHSVAYTPAKTRHYESALRYAAQQAMDGTPLLDGPLSLSILVRRPVPQSWSQKKQAQALAGNIHPTTKPDLDNHEKVLDALNGVVWRDDSQVVFKMSSKVYSDKPGLRIEVAPLAAAVDAEQKQEVIAA